MKVGDQPVYGAEGVARQNHELRFRRPGLQRTVGQGRTFEGTNDRGSDRPHPATLRAHLSNTLGELRTDVVALRMHLVPFRIVHLHRLEGAGPDLKVEAFDQDTGLAETVKQGWCEMKSSGGSGNAPFLLGVHRLIA